MTVCTAGRYYPFHLILLTIPVLVSSLSLFENNGNGAAIALSSPDFKDAKSAFPQSPLSLFAQDGDGSTNVPIQMCDSSQHHKHAELATVYLNPPCEKAYQAYCGVRRNQNYSLAIHFLTKVPTKSFSVQVTTIDPTFGWETPLWPVRFKHSLLYFICIFWFDYTTIHFSRVLIILEAV